MTDTLIKTHRRTDILYGTLIAVMLVFLVFYMNFIFQQNTTKDVSLSAVQDKMREDIAGLKAGDSNTLKRYFSLNAADYTEVSVYTSGSMMDVRELLLVKVQNKSQMDELEAAVAKRLDTQKKNFKGYGTNQTELLNNAIIKENGSYFFYGVSEIIEKWEEDYLSAIR